MAKKSLLMIDQDAYFAGIYANRFEKSGWKVWVEEALDGARKRLRRVRPDVIIVDLDPPTETIEFLSSLRADPKTAQSLLVALTKLADRTSMKQVLEAGVDRYLLKGQFPPSEAVKKIKRFLEEKTSL